LFEIITLLQLPPVKTWGLTDAVFFLMRGANAVKLVFRHPFENLSMQPLFLADALAVFLGFSKFNGVELNNLELGPT
jgi:hypothetical protein